MTSINNLLTLVFLVVTIVTTSSRAAPPVLGAVSINTVSPTNYGIRHCNFDGYVTPVESENDDFNFVLVHALNGNPNAVSIQSVNYPSLYIGPDPHAEKGRLGILDSSNVDDASFLILPGLSDANLYSLQTLSTTDYKGFYITYSTMLTGTCSSNYRAPAGDLFLTNGTDRVGATWVLHVAPPPPPAAVTVYANNVTHQINPLIMGCHSDSGYTHQPRGFYSQLIYGESFEEKWNVVISPGVMASSNLDPTQLFNTKPSMSIHFDSGNGFAGLSNRGLGNEGLVFKQGNNYEVEIWVHSSATVILTARLDDYVGNKVLASTSLKVAPTSGWTKLSFDLTPTDSTGCVGIAPNSDPEVDCGKLSDEPGHICVKCFGQFTVGLSSPGIINIGYVFLQPGTWGRYKGLPVLLSAVQNLELMGITAIRQGGTFAETIKWKEWRGPAISRASMQLKWGDSLVSGWGPFEMIDLCNSAGIEPIITLSEDQTTTDWADLLEYCFGGSNTQWGAQRIADGHAAPYNVKTFELGNEQYNTAWVDQVKAMEDRANSLGLGGQIFYMFPTNDGLSAADAQRSIDLKLPVDHIMPDIHVGAGGAVGVASSDFQKLPNFHQSAINCETNAGTHHHGRALLEAIDLNDWFNAAALANRLRGRTASFCTERSGHFDAFDQGISFFLPNMTWIQPPGYVHQLITNTWQPNGLAWSSTSISSGQSFSAQRSVDGKTLVVRFVNLNGGSTGLTITFNSFTPSPSVSHWMLSASSLGEANIPSDPTHISPRNTTITWRPGQDLSILPYSYNVLVFTQ